ncbi:nucleoside-diphosphate kinase [Lyticum sinuosum]|uniref:Nucleoside diphosphate kinase n=1 Tax=Lyticum sinuosum TaxID=1332059 RepID=A0AAE5AGW9_9RICK|nr:nucleoside-diphosphate kinase [Lyticum sinuosum]MDZ5761297.1 Nucleoside diphosphate kinase [Lyticum sinuosum]
MPIQKTLSIIKPDAVARNLIGIINHEFESRGLKIIAQKMIKISIEQASMFYYIHKDRPFFNELIHNISSGPVVVQVLEGENGILKNREIMGATDPKNAEDWTIRAKYAKSIDENSVHGSDSEESAKNEISFFFSDIEIYNR